MNARTDLGPEEEERLFALMEEHIAPRVQSLSTWCSDAIVHIKRVLHLGIYQRPSFLLRPFIHSPTPLGDDEMNFSDLFEAEITKFWLHKHLQNQSSFASTADARPHAASLLICYMESTLYAMALRLLTFSRWADELRSSGIMTSRRVIWPKPKRYAKALRRTFAQLRTHFTTKDEESGPRTAEADMVGHDESLESKTHEVDASEALLVKPKPTLRARSGMFFKFLNFLYRAKLFLFDSSVSGFGLRAAIAMIAGALPAYFPDSVGVFLRYRLIWIAFTVLLGLQPVLGRGVAALGFRMIGTIVGGVAGLVVVEAGRVPGGILPLFFITLIPQFYLLQIKPKLFFLPVLLSVITEDLVIGYELGARKLGLAAVERSGQEYLQAPAVMGYRILLTLAGVVIVLIFSICPGLPTAKTLLQQTVAKRFSVASDMYLLCSLRGMSDEFELPSNIEKAISQKTSEALAISASSHDLLGTTQFEFSVRGKFPRDDWARLLVLIDNFMTSLSVANILYTRLQEDDNTEQHLRYVRGGIHKTSEDFFRIVSASLYALNGSFNLWQPLAPILRSPVAAHKETQKQLMDLSALLKKDAQGGDVSPDFMTHFEARVIAKTMMSRYLEEILQSSAGLIGQSGFKTYLRQHQKLPKSE